MGMTEWIKDVDELWESLSPTDQQMVFYDIYGFEYLLENYTYLDPFLEYDWETKKLKGCALVSNAITEKIYSIISFTSPLYRNQGIQRHLTQQIVCKYRNNHLLAKVKMKNLDGWKNFWYNMGFTKTETDEESGQLIYRRSPDNLSKQISTKRLCY